MTRVPPMLSRWIGVAMKLKADERAVIHWARLLVALQCVVIDTETTGFGGSDEVFALGAVQITDGAPGKAMQWKVKPLRPLHPEVEKLTKVTTFDLQNCPDFRAVHPAVADFCLGRVVIAFNAPFDRGKVYQTCAVRNLPLPTTRRWECLMSATTQFFGGKHDLEWCCNRFNIILTNAHDALHDARATASLLVALARIEEG